MNCTILCSTFDYLNGIDVENFFRYNATTARLGETKTGKGGKISLCDTSFLVFHQKTHRVGQHRFQMIISAYQKPANNCIHFLINI